MDAKELPVHPNLEQFRSLAKDIVKAYNSGDPESLRRIEHQFQPGRQLTRDIVREGIQRRLHKLHKFRIRNSKIALLYKLGWLVKKLILKLKGINVNDAQLLIGCEYGFWNWHDFTKHIEEMDDENSPVAIFESAVDAIITGNISVLERLLRENPELIRARSMRTHRSTLLHYVSANGVEDFRQKTPINIVEILKILLKTGADVNAESEAYGGGSTTLGLAATSVHPAKAGVQIALLETLLENGAAIDDPGYSTVNSCLTNGRGDAAEFLALRGARLDLEGAAGVGRLDIVKSFFKEDGSLKVNATEKQMKSGFAWACEFGRTSVVDFLLQQGMKVDIKLLHHRQTGLHWAAYGGHLDLVKMLLEHKAPVNAKDESFGGTPLGWALYGWVESPPEAQAGRYYDVVAMLVNAGATVDQEWLDDPDRELPLTKKMRADPHMISSLRGEMTVL